MPVLVINIYECATVHNQAELPAPKTTQRPQNLTGIVGVTSYKAHLFLLLACSLFVHQQH